LDYNKLNYINFTQKELEEMIAGAKSGDMKAFERLSGHVRHISYSYFISKQRQGKIINTEDADDLANNVYMAFAQQYQYIENLEYWLRRVLFLTFISFYKKKRNYRVTELDEAHYLEQKELNPGDKVDADEILKKLKTFSEDKQKVVRMRIWEDMKFSEIAEGLKKSEDAVKKIFYRTIEELKNKF
jgi:RNA polymerase sigma factor (sigma-70 family)